MTGDSASVVHINITNFAAAVAAAKNSALADSAFIIAKMSASRSVVISASQRAREEGIAIGMPVSSALRLVPSLAILPPDSKAQARAESELYTIASRFSPTIQQDSGGHVYIDVSGTTRLFGPPVDCAVRMRNEIFELLGMKPAIAVASNKLVAKIGTRAIRPSGLTLIRQGNESSFLAKQDISLLPGVGPTIGRLLSVAGFQDIGELAELDDAQVVSLLGKRGIALRNAAMGWDAAPVDSRSPDSRTIQRRIDFAEPVLEASAFRAALITAAEDAGLTMRQELMACKTIWCTLFWVDGSTTEGSFTSTLPVLVDAQIINGAWSALQQAAKRRVRIRAIGLSLKKLVPARREPDLFTPPGTSKEEQLQSAVDATRMRFGIAALTHAAAVIHV